MQIYAKSSQKGVDKKYRQKQRTEMLSVQISKAMHIPVGALNSAGAFRLNNRIMFFF